MPRTHPFKTPTQADDGRQIPSDRVPQLRLAAPPGPVPPAAQRGAPAPRGNRNHAPTPAEQLIQQLSAIVGSTKTGSARSASNVTPGGGGGGAGRPGPVQNHIPQPGRGGRGQVARTARRSATPPPGGNTATRGADRLQRAQDDARLGVGARATPSGFRHDRDGRVGPQWFDKPDHGQRRRHGGVPPHRRDFDPAELKAIERATDTIAAGAARHRLPHDVAPRESATPHPPKVAAADRDHKVPQPAIPILGEIRGVSGGAVAGVALNQRTYQRGLFVANRYSVRHRGVTRNVVVIKGREPLGTYRGTATYSPIQFVGNPGNSSTHPWAYVIARNYDEFFYTDSQLEFVTELGTNIKGRVGMNYDYEATDPMPPSRLTFEQQAGSRAGADWGPLKCRMRLPPSARTRFYFVSDNTSTGPGGDADGRVTSQFLMQFFTDDCADTTVIGELWHSYTVHLMEPTASQGAQLLPTPAIFQAGTAGSTGTAMANLLGIPVGGAWAADSQPARVPGSSTDNFISPGSGTTDANNLNFRVYFKSQVTGSNVSVAGSYRVVIGVLTSAVTPTISTNNGTCVAAHSTAWNGATDNVAITSNGVGGLFWSRRFDVTGGTVFVPGNLDTAGPYLNVGIAVPAGTFTALYVTVCPMGVPGSTGPQLSVGRYVGDDFVQTDKYIIPCIDGDVTTFVRRPPVYVQTAPPINDLGRGADPDSLDTDVVTVSRDDVKGCDPLAGYPDHVSDLNPQVNFSAAASATRGVQPVAPRGASGGAAGGPGNRAPGASGAPSNQAAGDKAAGRR